MLGSNAMLNESTPRLRLFGRIELQHGPVAIRDFPTKRCALILGRLAFAHQHRMSREQLAEVLWPGDPYELSRGRMRKELSRLQQTLGEQRRILLSDGEFLELDTENLEIDVKRFEFLSAKTVESADPEARLREMVALSREPFLAEADDDWIQIERLRLKALRTRALVELSRLLFDAGRSEEALAFTAQALEVSPEHEGARKLHALALAEIGEASPELTVRYPLEPLFGREEELVLIQEKLKGPTRLLSILGMGGIGKSHLLRHAAAKLAPDFDNRVVLIDLSDQTDAGLIPATILQALGLGYSLTGDPASRLIRVLANAPTLLILDNLEQFGGTVTPVVKRLLEGSATVRILAGSRIPLNIGGEFKFALNPLAMPGESANRCEAESSPAMQLFLNWAGSSGAQIKDPDWPAVSNIVRRLEGIPLGLQLAASRLRSTGSQDLLSELEAGLDRLVSWRADSPPRHRSIRNALAGSLDVLPENLRSALASLAIFRGGWTLESARRVCGIDHVEETMERLLDASLIQVLHDTSPRRFRMLETIREYSLELLSPARAKELRRALVAWLIERSERVAFELVTQPVVEEIDRMEPELDNLREGLRFAMEEDPDAAFVLGGNCLSLWLNRTSGFEAANFYRDLFRRHGERAPSKAMLAARYAHAVMLHYLRSDDRAEVYARTIELGRTLEDRTYALKMLALEVFYFQNEVDYAGCRMKLREIDAFVAEHGWLDSEGFVLRSRGNFLHHQSEFAASLADLQASERWFRAKGELFFHARARQNMAFMALDMGDLKLARTALDGLMETARALRFSSFIPLISASLGRLAFEDSNFDEAAAQFSESLRLWTELGDPFHIADQKCNLGRTRLAQNRVDEAFDLFRASALSWQEHGFPMGVCTSMFAIAEIYLRHGDAGRAAQIFRSSRYQGDQAKAKFIVWTEDFAQAVERDLCAALGDDWLKEPPLSVRESLDLAFGESVPFG